MLGASRTFSPTSFQFQRDLLPLWFWELGKERRTFWSKWLHVSCREVSWSLLWPGWLLGLGTERVCVCVDSQCGGWHHLVLTLPGGGLHLGWDIVSSGLVSQQHNDFWSPFLEPQRSQRLLLHPQGHQDYKRPRAPSPFFPRTLHLDPELSCRPWFSNTKSLGEADISVNTPPDSQELAYLLSVVVGGSPGVNQLSEQLAGTPDASLPLIWAHQCHLLDNPNIPGLTPLSKEGHFLPIC